MSIMPSGGWDDSSPRFSQEESVKDPASGLILAGYLCCFMALLFLPPAFALAGFVVGVVTVAKGRVGHGVILVVLSVTLGLAGMYFGARVVTEHWGKRALAWVQQRQIEVSDRGGNTAAAQLKHAIGDSVSAGYWTYRCNGTQWMSLLVSDFGSMEQPDAAYLVVDITIRNDDRSASTRPPMKLIDSQGREFSESSKEYVLPQSIGTLKELNPSVSSRGYVLFDVPPQGKYVLKVSGGFESDDFKLIDLPKAQLQEDGRGSAEPAEQLP
jgi:hypothetical protein